MNSENTLLEELSRTIQYTKFKVTNKLAELQRDNKIDLTRDEAAKLSEILSLAIDQVYRDLAPGFSKVKEQIREEKRAIETKTKKK